MPGAGYETPQSRTPSGGSTGPHLPDLRRRVRQTEPNKKQNSLLPPDIMVNNKQWLSPKHKLIFNNVLVKKRKKRGACIEKDLLKKRGRAETQAKLMIEHPKIELKFGNIQLHQINQKTGIILQWGQSS